MRRLAMIALAGFMVIGVNAQPKEEGFSYENDRGWMMDGDKNLSGASRRGSNRGNRLQINGRGSSCRD